MKDDHPIFDLIETARHTTPFGEGSEFGFETRLRAAMHEVTPSVSEWVATFSWRFSFACLPLLVAVALFLAFGQTEFVPEGVGGFVSHWSSYLPIEL